MAWRYCGFRKGIYARDVVEISRNTMANWMGHVAFHLAPLADRILALIKEGERVYADETTLPTLSPGSGRTKTAWLWTYARDDRTFGGQAPPMVAYRFEDSRGGESVERHLAGYTGLLQVDDYHNFSSPTHPSQSDKKPAAGLDLTTHRAAEIHGYRKLHQHGEGQTSIEYGRFHFMEGNESRMQRA